MFLLSRLLKTILVSYLARRTIKTADVFITKKRQHRDTTSYCGICTFTTNSSLLLKDRIGKKCICCLKNNEHVVNNNKAFMTHTLYLESLTYVY